MGDCAVRIDKVLSELGMATRRESSALAKRGAILVDGVPVRDASVHIDPEKQILTVSGRKITYRRFTYVMLNKPEGYVSATEDSKLPVVTELLPSEYRRMELFPVGRLDRDTVGLMILTNDGPLAHSLLSPRHHVEKEYFFKCAEPLSLSAEQTFASGVTLKDGYECKSAGIVMDEGRLSGYITLTEGKYHQIKRMIASLGNKVTYLKRIRFADIRIDGALGAGEWRELTSSEIESLLNKIK